MKKKSVEPESHELNRFGDRATPVDAILALGRAVAANTEALKELVDVLRTANEIAVQQVTRRRKS